MRFVLALAAALAAAAPASAAEIIIADLDFAPGPLVNGTVTEDRFTINANIPENVTIGGSMRGRPNGSLFLQTTGGVGTTVTITPPRFPTGYFRLLEFQVGHVDSDVLLILDGKHIRNPGHHRVGNFSYGLRSFEIGIFPRFPGSTGYAEIFNVTFQTVPEPATWAMLILGFGAVGTALRRRTSLSHRERAARLGGAAA